eukprot:scaffold42528_cov53-Phaeocystis_antarctica.AAC.3
MAGEVKAVVVGSRVALVSGIAIVEEARLETPRVRVYVGVAGLAHAIIATAYVRRCPFAPRAAGVVNVAVVRENRESRQRPLISVCVALEARQPRGGSIMRKTLAFDVAVVRVDRGAAELARRAGRDARGQSVIGRHLDDEHCALAIFIVLLLQVVGSDSTHNDGVGRRVANGDGPLRGHGHVVEPVVAPPSDEVAPQSDTIGRLELAHDRVRTGRDDHVLRVKRERVIVTGGCPHEIGVCDDASSPRYILGPHTLSIGLTELDQEAAQSASHGAGGLCDAGDRREG